mmetsp:Transcript_28453/g.59405  ORF Transcript_28453/g.59405 Transcript_28453/m.59405 type:complete len:83 (-) Transcript_28453:5-253(-)
MEILKIALGLICGTNQSKNERKAARPPRFGKLGKEEQKHPGVPGSRAALFCVCCRSGAVLPMLPCPMYSLANNIERSKYHLL